MLKKNSLSWIIYYFILVGRGRGSPNNPIKLIILLNNEGMKAAESVLNLKSTTTSSLQGSIISYHKEHTNTPRMKSLASFFTNLPPFSSALDRNWMTFVNPYHQGCRGVIIAGWLSPMKRENGRMLLRQLPLVCQIWR